MLSEVFYENIDKFLRSEYDCSCGKAHKIHTKRILVGDNTLIKVFEIIQELNLGNKALLVADDNTYIAAGKRLNELLNKRGMYIKLCIYHCQELHADENTIKSLLSEFTKDMDFLIAVGSGTVNDIVRYASFKINVPYICIPTAPSMDGYASTVSPLMVNGLKKTFPATFPTAIIGDTNVLCNAPMPMIAAGLGDMIGKITALSDWVLGKTVNGEYYCSEVVKVVISALKQCVINIDGLAKRDRNAVRSLTEGLILSGIAMQMTNNSRPASGAEHHLSHFWEMRHYMKGQSTPLHGTKVGVATNIILEFYKKVFDTDLKKIDFNTNGKPDISLWKKEMQRCYGSIAQELINESVLNALTGEELDVKISIITDKWEGIKSEIHLLFDIIPDIKSIIKKVGGISSPSDLRLSHDDIYDALLYAKELRNRYTILQLADQMGVLDRYAKEIINEIY